MRGRRAVYLGRSLPCEIGRGGARPDKREGDGATPAGRWRLTAVLWRADRGARPATALPVRPIGPRDGWSDDPACPRYNAPVRLPSAMSAERLRRRDRLYDVVVVTDHNAARTPGAGSAAFLHVRRGPGRPTAGCVAFRESDLRWLLARWRRGDRLDVAPWRPAARRLPVTRDGD